MRYIIVDLEATCWENVRNPQAMEIIEIGAVEILSAQEPPVAEFSRFVRPVVNPDLSDFCQRLTSITQFDVDEAQPFPEVLDEFTEWVGWGPFTLCSWGAYDLSQFRIDCRRHNIPLPHGFENHINLKKEFARLMNNRRECGMSRALSIMGLKMEGTHHRGIDDAYNIAKLANIILPVLESS